MPGLFRRPPQPQQRRPLARPPSGGPTNYEQSASDAISSVSDSLARAAAAKTRTLADSPSTLSEATSRVKSMPRTLADALSSLSESAARAAMEKARTGADALASLAEATAKVATHPRTLAESLGDGISESIARITGKARTVTDTLPSLSEATTKVVAALRSVAESGFSTLAEAAVGVKNGGAQAYYATVADALSSVADATDRVKGMARAVADALGGGAPAFVQVLGSTFTDANASTLVISPSSKTVTLGNKVFVSFGCYLGSLYVTGVTDNLGNTYSEIERTTGTNFRVACLWAATVTTGGSITTITITQNSNGAYRAGAAVEYSGIGSLVSDGNGQTGTGTPAVWANSITIPANGIVVGAATLRDALGSAGSASGSPSTTINQRVATNSVSYMDTAISDAIAGSSEVTGFTGTTAFTNDSYDDWGGASGIFNGSGGGISEATARLVGRVRSAADSMESLSETVVRSALALVRTIPDALSTLAEAVEAIKQSGQQNLQRTVDDALATLAEANARLSTFNRTVSDALASLAESVVRLFTGARSTSDTIGSLSETVGRITGKARTTADALASLSESVVRAAAAKARTIPDALASLSEAPTRLSAKARATSDALTSVTDALSRATAAKVRTGADALSSVTDGLLRAAQAKVRASGDSLPSLSEAADRIKGSARAAADSIASLSEAPVRAAMAVVRAAADTVSSLVEAAVRAAIAFIRREHRPGD